MSETKRLAGRAALTVAVAALVGVSAFAESRHENGTRGRRSEGGAIRRDGHTGTRERARRDETRNDAAVRDRSRRTSGSEIEVRGERTERRSSEARVEPRSDARVEPRRDARVERRDDARVERRSDNHDRRGSNDSWRDQSRNRNEHRGNDRYDSRSQRSDRGRYDSRSNHSSRNHGGRQPYYAHGRVSRVHPYGGGYRIWVDGARYPFYVPSRYYHRDRFRIGLVIRLGGWYNDSGYYDYYDGRSTGELYGVVESVDYRRNTFVVRNEATGNFVTVLARGAEADRLRAGDLVEIWGDWSRRGYFEARDVDRVDYR